MSFGHEVYRVHWYKKIRFVGEFFSAPNIPASCVAFKRMAKPVQGILGGIEVFANPYFQMKLTWDVFNTILPTKANLGRDYVVHAGISAELRITVTVHLIILSFAVHPASLFRYRHPTVSDRACPV